MCPFFSVSALDVSKRAVKVSYGELNYTGLFEASNMRRKKCKLVPPFFEKKHFYWTDFFETQIRASTQSIQVV